MYFEEELLTIQNEEIREQTKKVIANINEQFFIVPASSSGKYHPRFALGKGGLYKHTKACVKIANSLFELSSNKFSDTLKDYIRAALILHDSCKSGINWEYKYTVHEHPVLACKLIEKVLGQCEYTDAVTNLVKTHMGKWTTNKKSKVILQEPSSMPQEFVHVCDYLASRQFIEIHFD